MTPKEIPSEIEYRKGIAMIAMKAGIASPISSKSILRTEESIMKPTIIRAGAVAKEGIARKIGERNSARPNRIPEVTLVSPVRPPAMTPEELSTSVSYTHLDVYKRQCRCRFC